MTSASKSVYYFGFYLLLTGITLIAIPNVFLSLFRIAETTEVWIHVLGAVVFAVGLLYVRMAPTNHTLFFMLTVYARLTVLFWFVVFVIFGWAPLQLLVIGVVDAAGAAWTYASLRK